MQSVLCSEFGLNYQQIMGFKHNEQNNAERNMFISNHKQIMV
jgi:hypothetical protein